MAWTRVLDYSEITLLSNILPVDLILRLRIGLLWNYTTLKPRFPPLMHPFSIGLLWNYTTLKQREVLSEYVKRYWTTLKLHYSQTQDEVIFFHLEVLDYSEITLLSNSASRRLACSFVLDYSEITLLSNTLRNESYAAYCIGLLWNYTTLKPDDFAPFPEDGYWTTLKLHYSQTRESTRSWISELYWTTLKLHYSQTSNPKSSPCGRQNERAKLLASWEEPGSEVCNFSYLYFKLRRGRRQ